MPHMKELPVSYTCLSIPHGSHGGFTQFNKHSYVYKSLPKSDIAYPLHTSGVLRYLLPDKKQPTPYLVFRVNRHIYTGQEHTMVSIQRLLVYRRSLDDSRFLNSGKRMTRIALNMLNVFSTQVFLFRSSWCMFAPLRST